MWNNLGEICGAAQLDSSFRNYIITVVGKPQWDSSKISADSKRRMMAEFENAVKRRFDLGSERQYSVVLNGVEDNKQFGIEGNMIPLHK